MITMTSKGLAFLALSVLLVGMAATATLALGVDANTRTTLLEIAKQRHLSGNDIYAAAATFTTAAMKDEFICLNSGGQAGSMIAYAVPSMRILKYIPTGTPDSTDGYGFDEQTRGLMRQGDIDGQHINWADTHHPAFSETDGKYDGHYAFLNDKANPRIFVIDLRDFETKQIVTNPIYRSDHGGSFATPNTEYIIEGAQYPAPPDRQYHPLTQENFNKFWRGGITFHKFDTVKGRIIPADSFTVLAPPYSQDLSDAGKGESYGYSFTNSFCSERYVGGIEADRPPYEAGCSANDTDYMHVIDWKKAEKIAKEGKKTIKINGHTVIPMEVAAAEGVLFLIPEPKSPHGADVTPDGRYIIVAGKLDTHATVFDIRKIKDLIARKDFAEHDAYGIPILDMAKSMHGQVELGLGPLHTQFDPKAGIAYTSVFIDSMVVKWDYLNLKVLDKVSVHYNIGHLVSMQGDSQDPRGKYVIALNKLSLDRFDPVGPLHPQNHQLIDVSGDKMRLIYDLPFPMGEPHYTVCIDATKVKPIDVYPAGTDVTTMQPSPVATQRGQEKVTRQGQKVEVFGTVAEDGVRPLRVDVEQGDEIFFHLTNVEQTADRTLKFTVNSYNALGILPPGKVGTVRFTASQAGLFNFRASAVDATFDSRIFGRLVVKPNAVEDRKRLALVTTMRLQKERLHALPAGLQTGSKQLAEGEAEFESYGCGGCHVRGLEKGGPDLTDVAKRHDAAWLKLWIANPEKHYDEPSIEALIKHFGVKMPNQGVPPQDIDKIITYISTWQSVATADNAASGESGPGPELYGKICFACHANGVGGAPKIGDKAAWAPRLAQGMATLYTHALGGFQGKSGFMPPKGGCADCSDEQVKAAVDFITSKAK